MTKVLIGKQTGDIFLATEIYVRAATTPKIWGVVYDVEGPALAAFDSIGVFIEYRGHGVVLPPEAVNKYFDEIGEF